MDNFWLLHEWIFDNFWLIFIVLGLLVFAAHLLEKVFIENNLPVPWFISMLTVRGRGGNGGGGDGGGGDGGE
ncbi:MAG: hypothetical protein VX610_04515 [SAR324 cluster bacterium]|nr:hypothetical protein [SAR324 cluster bacterium]